MNPLLLACCERMASALFADIWHAALLLGVVALTLRLLPVLTAATRSLIWTAALLMIVAMPFLPAQPSQAFERMIDAGRGIHLNPVWSLCIAAAWLVFSIVRAAQLSMSALRLRIIATGAVPVSGATKATVATSFGFRRSATLCVSDEVARPSVIGFFSPRILVPRDLYPKLSAEEIDQIVLHEMEHLRRGDDWRNLVQKLAVMLFPLNPALLWIERRLCFERELACDESVLAHTHAPKSYAACLVHLAEERSLGRQLSLALGAWERRSELGRRVHGILANRTPASFRVRVLCGSGITAAMIAGTLLLANTPQLLSFNNVPAALGASSSSAPAMETAEKVNFRSSAASRPRMIDTMMRLSAAIPASIPAPARTRPVHLKVARPRQVTVSALQPLQRVQPRVVLTSVKFSDGISTIRVQRVTFAVFEISNGTQSSYSETAQPVPGGLFILQL